MSIALCSRKFPFTVKTRTDGRMDLHIRQICSHPDVWLKPTFLSDISLISMHFLFIANLILLHRWKNRWVTSLLARENKIITIKILQNHFEKIYVHFHLKLTRKAETNVQSLVWLVFFPSWGYFFKIFFIIIISGLYLNVRSTGS